MNIQPAQLPMNVLFRVKNYAEQLRGKEIAPRLLDEPHTEEHILLGKMGRQLFLHHMETNHVSRAYRTVDASLVQLVHNAPPLSPNPVTPAERAIINQRLEEGHTRLMHSLASVLKQIDILRSDPNFDFQGGNS